MKNKFTLLILPLAISGCMSLEPKYEKPINTIPVDFSFNNYMDTEYKVVIAEELYWKNYIKNEKLKKVVESAIINNKDIAIAISNIEVARAKYGIEKSNKVPSFDLNYSGQKGNSDNVSIDSSKLDVTVTSYELDIFGRIKNLSNSALEVYSNSEDVKNTTEILIRSEVIKAYYDVAHYKTAYLISKKTEISTKNNLELVKKRLDNGIAKEKDLNDAKSLYLKSSFEKLTYSTNIEKSINYLNYIVGEKVPDKYLPKDISELKNAISNLDKNFNSDILLNRPDILGAEHMLKSKNANIGAARAAFFPRISLTASTGIASNDLSALFNNNFSSWLIIPNINIPIFDGGKNKSNLEVSEAEKEIALKTYEKTLQKAFYEVLDELAIKSKINDRLSAYNLFVVNNEKSYNLAKVSYKLGLSNYLDVLISQQSFYGSELQELSVKREDFYNKISLYKVLGY